MIEVLGVIEPGVDIHVGTFRLHLEQPFTSTYDKEGRLVHFEVLATDYRWPYWYYVALHKDERFKGLVKEEVESNNPHLSYMKDAQPLLKLSRTTIQRVLDRMLEIQSAV